MKKIKGLKKILIALAAVSLIGTSLSLTLGGSDPGEAVAEDSNTVAVQRGNLSLEITAAGNLALSQAEDLAIDLFYQEGTVAEVLVEEGNTVTEGQELVRLDEDEWNDELSSLEKALTTAERSLTSKENALIQAERQVTTAERQVAEKELAVTEAEREITAKELAVDEAELDLETAEYNLSQIEEVAEAQEDVDSAQYQLDFVESILTGELGAGLASVDYSYWQTLKYDAEENLDYYQEVLAEILDGSSVSLTTSAAISIAKYQLSVTKAELALEDARLAVTSAERAVEDAGYNLEEAQFAVTEAEQSREDAKLDVEDAKTAVEEAQSDLAAAQNLSPVITAPFDGFVTQVGVEGGEEVMKGTVAVQIADPNKFEADILVSELDIAQVELGGAAVVAVDALDLNLEATITHISPTATISSGVVNYDVTVEVTSVPEDANLKEGMTVTVSLVIAESENVLLVPYTSISKENGQSYVQVMTDDGNVEKRAITAGVTDYQYTEVVEGLSEGEMVVTEAATTVSSTSTGTTQQQNMGGGMMMPGVGGGAPPAGG